MRGKMVQPQFTVACPRDNCGETYIVVGFTDQSETTAWLEERLQRHHDDHRIEHPHTFVIPEHF